MNLAGRTHHQDTIDVRHFGVVIYGIFRTGRSATLAGDVRLGDLLKMVAMPRYSGVSEIREKFPHCKIVHEQASPENPGRRNCRGIRPHRTAAALHL